MWVVEIASNGGIPDLQMMFMSMPAMWTGMFNLCVFPSLVRVGIQTRLILHGVFDKCEPTIKNLAPDQLLRSTLLNLRRDGKILNLPLYACVLSAACLLGSCPQTNALQTASSKVKEIHLWASRAAARKYLEGQPPA